MYLLQTVVVKFVLPGAPKGDDGSEATNISRDIHASPTANGNDIIFLRSTTTQCQAFGTRGDYLVVFNTNLNGENRSSLILMCDIHFKCPDDVMGKLENLTTNRTVHCTGPAGRTDPNAHAQYVRGSSLCYAVQVCGLVLLDDPYP